MTGQRLTPTQWWLAINALAHVQADAEAWDSDGDPNAVPLWAGIEVIQQLIDARRPLGYAKHAQQYAEQAQKYAEQAQKEASDES